MTGRSADGGAGSGRDPRRRSFELELTRRELLRRAGLGGAIIAMPSLLTACGADDEQAATGTGERPAGGGEIETLNWGAQPIRALDYAHSFDVQTGAPVAIALESLLTYTNDLELAPLLAESWEQPDPLTYVYTLREGVEYWDGTPFAAEDVVFSLERHRDPKVASEMGFYFGTVESVEATGPLEVTVKLKSPDPFFNYLQTFVSITPKAFSEAQGNKLGTPGAEVTTMGTGPYEVTGFAADESVTLVRNERYWGEKPAAKAVNIKMFADPQAMQLAMRAGEIDGTLTVPLPQVDQWDSIEGTEIVSARGLNIMAFYFRVDTEPWSDIHVRRAFAYAIDREGLVESVLGGHGEVANSVVPPAQWGGLLPADEVEALYAELPSYSFDIEMAKEELAQSSVPDGFSATAQYPNVIAEAGKALQNLAQNLKELNIDLTVKEVTIQKWFEDLDAERFPFGIAAFAPDYPDPANYPSIVFSPGSDSNRAHYENEDVTRLLAEQREATDPAARGNAIAEILRIAEPELPYLPLWWPEATMAIRDKYTYDGYSALWYNQIWVKNVKPAA